MMRHLRLGAFLCLLMQSLVLSALATMTDDESWRQVRTDPDYAAGLEAFTRQDWQSVVDHMTNLVARRPWDDNAYAIMGYAYRKLGDYRRSLVHYQQALDLNPYHRGALEYLGEAYVEMGCQPQARQILARLETVCKQSSAGRDWQSTCTQWQDLNAAIDADREPDTSDCILPQPLRKDG